MKILEVLLISIFFITNALSQEEEGITEDIPIQEDKQVKKDINIKEDEQDKEDIQEDIHVKKDVQMQEDASEPDTSVEVYEYSTTDDEYQTETKPQQDSKIIEITSPEYEAPSTTYSEMGVIPPAPDRPIGKTVVGVILTVQGGVFTGIATFIFIFLSAIGEQPEGILITLPYLGAGLGQLIPGISMISGSTRQWKIYNDWEQKYKYQSSIPTLKLQYSFEF